MNTEEEITRCKEFYKQYLQSVKDHGAALVDLKKAIAIKEQSPGSSPNSRLSTNYNAKELEIESILKKHFTVDLFNLYKKEIKVKSDYSKSSYLLKQKSGFWEFMAANILDSFEERKTKNLAQSNHEVTLLKYTYYCLTNFGLHPKIKERDPKKYKRFNLLIKYKTQPRSTCQDYILHMPFSRLDNIFIQYFRNRKPIQLNGKIIPHVKITEVKITTTLLQVGELNLFLRSKNIESSTIDEAKLNFLFACQDETNRYLPHPDEKVILKQSNDFHDTQVALIKFPKALTLFNSALEKRLDEKLSRNCLDDLRLCLETFLKEKLKNKKSLENQVAALGQYLKSKNENNQVTELLHKVLDFYSKYQNENVKHNDNVKKRDVNFILKLTSNLIEHLSVI